MFSRENCPGRTKSGNGYLCDSVSNVRHYLFCRISILVRVFRPISGAAADTFVLAAVPIYRERSILSPLRIAVIIFSFFVRFECVCVLFCQIITVKNDED